MDEKTSSSSSSGARESQEGEQEGPPVLVVILQALFIAIYAYLLYFTNLAELRRFRR